MRKLTTILILTILALGCNAQEPHLAYSVEYVDSLNNIISTLKENASIMPDLINADTLNIEIYGGGASVMLDKKSYNIKLTLLHDSKRIYIDYLPNDLNLTVMDSTFTRLSQHIDLI